MSPRAAIVLAVALLATLVPSETVAAGGDEEPMTEQRAGAYYTNHVCPVNLAGRKYYRKIWRGRDWITKREVARRLPEIRRYAPPYSREVYRWSRVLLNPPAPWPDDVAWLVKRMANISLRLSELLRLKADAWSARRWLNLNERINNLPSTRAATIRARLNLPRVTRCRR